MSYSTTTTFSGPNTFLRLDYHLNNNNQTSFRWTREAILTERDTIEDDKAILDAARYENDAGDQVFSCSLASVLNNKTTNEIKIGHVRESLLQGRGSCSTTTGSSSASTASNRSTSARRTRIPTTSPARATPTRRT